MERQIEISSDDPMKRAIMRIFGKLGDDEFICPYNTGIASVVTLDDCELKSRGSGCSDMLTCEAYQRAKKKIRKEGI
jgi:hypothetical protein